MKVIKPKRSIQPQYGMFEVLFRQTNSAIGKRIWVDKFFISPTTQGLIEVEVWVPNLTTQGLHELKQTAYGSVDMMNMRDGVTVCRWELGMDWDVRVCRVGLDEQPQTVTNPKVRVMKLPQQTMELVA